MTRDEREAWIQRTLERNFQPKDWLWARELFGDAMAFADAGWVAKIKEMAELNRRTGNYERAAALFAMLE